MEIPEAIRRLLWEYDLDALEDTGVLDRVMFERIMERGGWHAMQWLLQSFSRDRLRTFLEDRGRRVLPARELRFWSWVCGVPDRVIGEWVDLAKTREQAWRGIP